MIRKLRRRFIFIASGAVLIMLSLVIVSINLISYYTNRSEIDSLLSFISDNGGSIPAQLPENDDVKFHITREFRYETRYFSIVLESGGKIVSSDYNNIGSVDSDLAYVFCDAVSDDDDESGRIEKFGGVYYYLSRGVSGAELNEIYSSRSAGFNFWTELDEDTEYELIVFVDCSDRMYRLKKMRFVSVSAAIGFFIVFVLLLSAFSKKAVQPFIKNYENQKKFITNAGHELKTPLAVISANTEVMEAMDGRTEWTESNMRQVERLTGLVNDLITLSKLEEAAESDDMQFESVDMTELVRSVAADMSTVAGQQGKALHTDIADDVKVSGSGKPLRELVTILADNAVKYCDDGGNIDIVLSGGKKQTSLTVSNDYKDGRDVDCSRFFDRFYRQDESHNSESAGYGIGLSMAETIVRIHGGRISAEWKNGVIYFNVIL